MPATTTHERDGTFWFDYADVRTTMPSCDAQAGFPSSYTTMTTALKSFAISATSATNAAQRPKSLPVMILELMVQLVWVVNAAQRHNVSSHCPRG